MTRAVIEPGLLRALQLMCVGELIVVPVARLIIRDGLGLAAIPPGFVAASLVVPAAMTIYTFVPWFRERLGGAFLPLGFIVLATNALLDKYLVLSLFTGVPDQPLRLLLLTLRLWLFLQILTAMIAWQYGLLWLIVSAIGLSIIDLGLSLPFIPAGGSLEPILLSILGVRATSLIIGGGGIAWLVGRERAQRRSLAEINTQLAQYVSAAEQLAVSRERTRLARELHDTLAHSVSAIGVQLEAINALWDVDPARARAMLQQALQTSRSGNTEARRALKALRASPLEDLGLARAVTSLAETAAERAGLRLDLDVDDTLGDVPPDVEQCIYRVAQESLANVVRHAEAHTIRVGLHRDGHCLRLTVADDGGGFDPRRVNGRGYGLRGLRERATTIGGQLFISSRPEHGALVELAVDLAGGEHDSRRDL